MSVKVLKCSVEDIPVKELPEGKVAVITQWDVSSYEGMVVQRCKDTLIELGGGLKAWWDLSNLLTDKNRVRILPEGTTLII